ncbi:MAG TPA: molybdopterin-dependent oxidoreductase [Bryobacteraceae bacterium]|nr:molybdopterin-dependent oxidoreductase [Bryobacteraceae bacterium]
MSEREIELASAEAKGLLGRRTRRAFLTGGIAAVAGLGAYEWLTKAGAEDDTPWPQRRVLAWNAKIAHAYLSDGHQMPSYSPSQVTYLKPNGDVGLGSDFDASDWKLKVSADGIAPFHLQLSDVTALPRRRMITRFCCIEGWSSIVSWGGARFADFTKKFFPPGRELPRFVYLATPDEEYYVGLDLKSALHPQTLLAWEQNEKPLTAEHGAPLRLVIPVKYGIKNLKRIGSIRYTNQKPGDYWAEQGYDWFAGL